MTHRNAAFISLAVLVFGACADGYVDEELDHEELSELEQFEEEYHEEMPDDGLGKADAVGTVWDNRNACGTRVVWGLSEQIVDEINCIAPDSLVRLSHRNIRHSGSAVFPYFTPEAAADLRAVADTRSVSIISGYRTVAQQWLLRNWRDRGRCRIRAAARPGKSNHESGRAIDARVSGSRPLTNMRNRNWRRVYSNHFRHERSPDLRGLDVLAFQRLWNRNNPSDIIAEDGDYGPQTEARLKKAPAAGFRTGAVCSL